MDLRTLAPVVFLFVVCVGNVQSSGYSSSRRPAYSGSIPAGFRVRYVARGTAGGRDPSTSQHSRASTERQQLRGPNVCSPNRCCAGWKINSATRTCTTPRCAFKCLHGGICVRPNRCSCQGGYRGVACHIAPRSYGGKTGGKTVSSPEGQRPTHTGTAAGRTPGQAAPVPPPKRRGDGFEAQAYTTTGGQQLYSVGRPGPETVALGSNGQIAHLQEGQGRQRITLTPGQSVSFVGGESHGTTAGKSLPLRPGQRVTIVGLPNGQGSSGGGTRSSTREGDWDQRGGGVRVAQIVGTGGSQQKVTLPDGRTVALRGFRVSSSGGGVSLPMAAQVRGSGLLGKQSTDPLAGEGSLSGGVTVVGQQNVRGMCYADIKGRQCVDPLGGQARVTQAECCKTFGKGWGDSCFMCPHMLGQVDGCPAGHQRNQTTGACADIDECKAFPGLCENGRCTNNPGSFHCSCRVGYMLDATGTRCIAEMRGRCYKEMSNRGQCGVDLTGLAITKHVCCCTIGESWGARCERCPDPNSQNFKWLCPGGLGFQRRTRYVGGRTDEQTRTDQVVDFDECSTIVNICQHGRCFNTIGSYYCLCNPGYRLEGSRTRCVAIPTRKNCETTAGLCPNGRCINFRNSYVCNCDSGYQYDPQEKACVESARSICETVLNLCPNGRCRPSGNSYTCVCNPGYKVDDVRKTCVAERTASVCETRPGLCRNGRCVNSHGSYLCMCNSGYRQDLGGRACVDINECSYRNGRCHHGTCVNTEGSFTCSCDDGYKLSPDRKSCIDLDECPSQRTCTSPNQCLNFMGSYYCMCSAGYRHHGDTKACIEEELNECAIDPSLCQNGECINTRGSFVCRCDTGYKTDDTMTQCLDEDECQLDPTLCPNGRCYNNEGSYVCTCDRGFHLDPSRTQCVDVDECESNSKLCRDGECVNTPGGYRCRCDQGYIPSPDQRGCVDVDECSIGNPCGKSVCQNLPGHFTCVCTQGLVFDKDTQRCVSAWLAEQRRSRKQCFSELKDLDFGCADNPAGFNVTKEECCCSLGVAWGDSCELFPCPSRNAADYLELCTTLSGFLMKHDQNNEIYIEDINECKLFNNPCNNAMCRNTPGSYVCICPDGYFLNEQELTCTDINECAQFPCGSGTCLNLPGSYECSCLGNQIPDPTKKRCVERPLTLPLEPPAASYIFEQHEVCWTSVIGPNLFCSNALPFNMTRAQCCCRSDVQAWGLDCQLCPKLGTGAFRDLCERIKPGTSVDQQAFYIENIGPVAGQVPLIPGQQQTGPADHRPGWLGPYAGGTSPGRTPPAQLPPGILAPRQGHLSAAFIQSEARLLGQGYASEPLDADCKIEGGCGFGRCLRVDGGSYICDCYSGYKLDNDGLKCVDMNECEELEDLCKNGNCINTAGSYICQCHPGHVPKQDQPNFCVEQQEDTETSTQEESLSRTEE
ncbi:latent-transforming growth factor beta-binding protein 1-like isoform X1 [Branchiostoma lanceolatum]|uniref:latent-transforming growth factor beta-binding protein 1-like isoform X1 n=1 Tax=Branchiostoma lanceolatum TaxID=7740 RepID=UPI0034558697